MEAPGSYTNLILRRMGYTGALGDGSSDAWLDAEPGRRDAYKSQWWDQSGTHGYSWDRALTPEEQQEALAYGTVPGASPYDGGGVRPVGFVEPLNEWQREGLTELAGPVTAGNDMYALAAGSLAQAPGAIDASRGPISGEAFTSRVGEYMNPFLDQVLDRTVGRLNDSAAEARARLMASQGFRKAFGDTSLGVQGAELDKNLMNSVGDATANLSYAGYNDAVDRAIGALTGERDRDYRAASGYGGLASTASGLGGALDQKQMTNTLNKLKAGTAVQGQNQNMLDVLKDEIHGVQNWDETKLRRLAEYLGAFPGSTMSNTASQEPNTASRLGNAATFLGGIDWDNIFG